MTTHQQLILGALLCISLLSMFAMFILFIRQAERINRLQRQLCSIHESASERFSDIHRAIKSVHQSLDTVAMGVAKCVPEEPEEDGMITFKNTSFPNFAIKTATNKHWNGKDLSEGIDVELRERFDTLCDHLGVRVHRPVERYKVFEYPKGQTDAKCQAAPG